MNDILKTLLLLACSVCWLTACSPSVPKYESYMDYPTYEGNLWPEYTPTQTVFKLWSPTATAIDLHFYKNGEGDQAEETLSMSKSDNHPGLWTLEVEGDQLGRFYTFQVHIGDKILDETPGIYAQAVGVNGQRAQVVDLAKTNPEGWNADKRPLLARPNDIILYELHVRDFTIAENSGSKYPGKFLGLTEEGTKSPDGLSTGIDHIKALGVTHVHLLPSFDYRSVDESKLNEPQYNWGYDPLNYNVPEGSYSTNPYDPTVRIREFKKMVQAFHKAGIRVILDVVYNHTGKTEDSNFNLESPGYYYRHTQDGQLSDASACGNETASDHPMMRKYIIESCKYWAKEYHLDGFRFDLMAVHDVKTMNELSAELKNINPTLFVYGEGWNAGTSPLPKEQQALKVNTVKLTDVAAFSDDIRDAVKGSVFVEKESGFIGGQKGLEESIKFGIVGATQHDSIDYQKVNYSKAPWANKPSQCINYVSCHDNNTLYDKLKMANPNASEATIEQLDRLAATIVLTSQGIPFLHAGSEMLRTKGGEHNSYNKPDAVNEINWSWKKDHASVLKYYEGLIAMRKHHPAFRMPTTAMIQENLQFMEAPASVVAYQIKNYANHDEWKNIMVIFNAKQHAQEMPLPKGNWSLVADGKQVKEKGIKRINRKVNVPAHSAYILRQL
ncbi:type I pullulanase [Persicobacter psychrovividus]|uniref:Type I pullulanase n=1 Tax=Persicobacter psychrovividus TaxID=387638 RepID=A0ABM7VGX6_9BACT|nr:type I pullulanase [Persicobacter psychrovividus]